MHNHVLSTAALEMGQAIAEAAKARHLLEDEAKPETRPQIAKS
jgi:hypothetical protein